MKAHVLIVDDEPGPREALVYALGRTNKFWTISEAGTLEEARRILQSPPEDRGPVDAVLTDLVLGHDTGGGIDVLEIAKRKDPFIMVILFTAQERELDRFEAYRHGAFDCVEKNVLGKKAWREISVKANAAIDFRRLALSQVDQQRRLGVLERFFDPRVLAAAQKQPGILAVRRRDTTVLLWDVRGFSELCRALEDQPETLQGFLFDYYSTATETLFHHGGILDKFLGDTVMALFCDLGAEAGTPGAGPGSAVAAALRLRRAFGGVCRKWRVQWQGSEAAGVALDLACAIHSGSSLVGNFGTASREQFTAIGPDVNLAFRLRRMSRPGQVLVSEATLRRLGPGYETQAVGVLDDDDQNPAGEPLRVFAVSGRAEDAG